MGRLLFSKAGAVSRIFWLTDGSILEYFGGGGNKSSTRDGGADLNLDQIERVHQLVGPSKKYVPRSRLVNCDGKLLSLNLLYFKS